MTFDFGQPQLPGRSGCRGELLHTLLLEVSEDLLNNPCTMTDDVLIRTSRSSMKAEPERNDRFNHGHLLKPSSLASAPLLPRQNHETSSCSSRPYLPFPYRNPSTSSYGALSNHRLENGISSEA